jgi:hypothetical protein
MPSGAVPPTPERSTYQAYPDILSIITLITFDIHCLRLFSIIEITNMVSFILKLSLDLANATLF